MSGSVTPVYLRGAVRVRRHPNVMTIRFDNSMRVGLHCYMYVYIVIFAKSRAESKDRDRKTATGPTTVRKDRIGPKCGCLSDPTRR